MSVLAWRPRTRILLLGLLVVLLAATAVVVGGRPSAQAFDCTSAKPKPNSCPYVKIDAEGEPYSVIGDLVDPVSGKVLHTWREDNKDNTIWHWRYYGGQEHVRLSITPVNDQLPKKTINFPAIERHCYLVDPLGVREVTTGCNDFADPSH